MNDKDKIQIHIEKGKFYFSSKKYKEAIKEFKQALEHDSENSEILYSLAVSYETSSDYDLAKETYQKVLFLDPEHELARSHLEKLLER